MWGGCQINWIFKDDEIWASRSLGKDGGGVLRAIALVGRHWQGQRNERVGPRPMVT